MTPEVIVIQRPGVDFSTLLGVAMKVMGHSLSATADASAKKLSDTSRYLAYLSEMRGSQPNGPQLLPHVSFGLLFLADEADMVDIWACCCGMSFVIAETQVRNVFMAVVTGTLAHWRDAVVCGTSSEIEPTVRYAFNKVHGLFKAEGLDLWPGFRQRPATDQRTYLLQDMRGR